MLSIEKTTLTNINFEAIISNPWLTVLGQGILSFNNDNRHVGR